MTRTLTLAIFIIAVGATALADDVDAQPSGASRPNAAKLCQPVKAGSHERYRLPAPETFSDGVSFATDWTRLTTGGWFGQQAMDSCRIRPDGFQTWHGKAAVRVEVQPGDDPLGLKSNSERAEMLTMQDARGRQIKESAGSGKQFYATSYYFPATWEGQQLPWSGFAPTDCSAGDQNQCNSWSFVWQFYGWDALGAAQTRAGGPQHYQFNGRPFTSNGLIEKGQWTDFVFLVDWNDGAYTIWRRDEGQTKFRQVLAGKAAVPAGRAIYVKQGLYRGGNVAGRTDVLWIGPTARGSSFLVVEQQAFGTGDGPM